MDKIRKDAEEFMKYNDKSISPYHAVHEAELILKSQNFSELLEDSKWDIKEG